MSKLYARVSSEKATKGQGGQDYIKITLIAGKDRKEVGQIDMTCENNELVIDFTNDELITTNLARGYIKGKKQKDEDEYTCICNEGGKTENHVSWSTKDYREQGNPVCPYCDDEMILI